MSELAKIILSAANELSRYIDDENKRLEENMTCDALQPPDYHDHQTCYELAKAAKEVEQQAARVKELEYQLKNVIEEKNNRRNQHQLELSAIKGYFKQQNEALKAENEALLNAINNHNEACISDCSARSDTDLCKAYNNRGRDCTECPKDYLIQLSEGEQ